MNHYFCDRCSVYGKGATCWNCGNPAVERDTEEVQDFAAGWVNATTMHRCVFGGGRQPLLT